MPQPGTFYCKILWVSTYRCHSLMQTLVDTSEPCSICVCRCHNLVQTGASADVVALCRFWLTSLNLTVSLYTGVTTWYNRSTCRCDSMMQTLVDIIDSYSVCVGRRHKLLLLLVCSTAHHSACVFTCHNLVHTCASTGVTT